MIFTDAQINDLLATAGRLTPRVRAASWQTLLELLTLTRIMANLNTLRDPIAHCTLLAQD